MILSSALISFRQAPLILGICSAVKNVPPHSYISPCFRTLEISLFIAANTLPGIIFLLCPAEIVYVPASYVVLLTNKSFFPLWPTFCLLSKIFVRLCLLFKDCSELLKPENLIFIEPPCLPLPANPFFLYLFDNNPFYIFSLLQKLSELMNM